MSESEIRSTDMPDEIIIDILSRLQVKSLLRFRCVSKHWKNIISDTHFSHSHLKKTLTSPNHHHILVPSSPFLSLPYTNINESIKLTSPSLNPTTSIKILGSCNGLICLIDYTQEIIIYNPSTRQHFKPFRSPQQALRSSHRTEFVYGFACGSNPNNPRVVRFPRFARDSSTTHIYDFIDTVGTSLNGCLHWLAHHGNNYNEHRVIASFSISKETFKHLSLPPQETFRPFYILGVLKDRLSALCDDMSYTDVDVWLMNEYGVENSWTRFIKIPLNTGVENVSYMMPLSFINSKEIVLEIDLHSFVIYNFEKKSFRHVGATQDLKWCGDAVVYVESLVSPEVSCVFY